MLLVTRGIRGQGQALTAPEPQQADHGAAGPADNDDTESAVATFPLPPHLERYRNDGASASADAGAAASGAQAAAPGQTHKYHVAAGSGAMAAAPAQTQQSHGAAASGATAAVPFRTTDQFQPGDWVETTYWRGMWYGRVESVPDDEVVVVAWPDYGGGRGVTRMRPCWIQPCPDPSAL